MNHEVEARVPARISAAQAPIVQRLRELAHADALRDFVYQGREARAWEVTG